MQKLIFFIKKRSAWIANHVMQTTPKKKMRGDSAWCLNLVRNPFIWAKKHIGKENLIVK